MKRFFLKIFSLLLFLFFLYHDLDAFDVVSTNTTAVRFTFPILSKALDRCTGTFFVGVGGQENDFSVALAQEDSMTFTPRAYDIIRNAIIISNGFGLLNTEGATRHGNTPATHFCLIQANSLSVFTARVDGTHVSETATTITDTTGNPAGSLSFLTTSSDVIFIRALDHTGAAEGSPGAHGIATVLFDELTETPTIIQGNPITGVPAIPLNQDNAQSTFMNPVTGTQTTGVIPSLRFLDMHWDSDLERLYVAVRALTDPDPTGNTVMYGILIGRLTDNCMLTFTNIAGNLQSASGLSISNIIGTPAADDTADIFAIRPKTVPNPIQMNINKVRTMRTSTGLYYLIINGGISLDGIIDPFTMPAIPVGNLFWALPLGSPNATWQGYIVQNMVTNATGCNSFPALDSPFPVDFSNLENAFCYVFVGNSPAPWQGSDGAVPSTQFFANDMVVSGDTVYVTRTVNRNASNDPGIWSSNAMFHCDGRIAAWTPWERAFTSTAGGTGGGSTGDQYPLFEVDAKTGKIWTIDLLQTEVLRTAWNIYPLNPLKPSSLPYVVSTNLPDGVFCILDLVGETPNGFTLDGFVAPNCFTLFGGFEKVLFIHTKGINNTIPAFNFGSNNLLTTNGLKRVGVFGSGAVTTLGYSNIRSDLLGAFPDSTYFFAGTQSGLYAFALADGTGFNPAGAGAFTTLDEGQIGLIDNSWHLVPGVNRPVTVPSIQSDCNGKMFFVGVDITSIGSITDKLYTFSLTNNVSHFVPRAIAQSGAAGIPKNSTFTGFCLLTGNADPNQCVDPQNYFGLLTTNNAIYTTTCDIREIIIPENNPLLTTTDWVPVDFTSNIGFNYLRRASKRFDISNKAYGIYFSENLFSPNPGVFQNSRFIQLGNCDDISNGTDTVSAKPNNQCENRVQSLKFWTSNCGLDLQDFSLNLWSDGSRRFFTRFNPQQIFIDSNISSLPYQCDEVCMNEPFDDPIISQLNRAYCIENISSTGQILVGTDFGVISFE